MILIRESIDICSSSKKLFSWLANLPLVYTSWHSDHVSCRVLKGALYEVGTVLECQEFLHGKLHTLKFHITEVVPDQRVKFNIGGIGYGVFEANDVMDKVTFVAELNIGTRIPVIGAILDIMLKYLFANRLGLLREHLQEEVHNLKTILESNQLGQHHA